MGPSLYSPEQLPISFMESPRMTGSKDSFDPEAVDQRCQSAGPTAHGRRFVGQAKPFHAANDSVDRQDYVFG